MRAIMAGVDIFSLANDSSSERWLCLSVSINLKPGISQKLPTWVLMPAIPENCCYRLSA